MTDSALTWIKSSRPTWTDRTMHHGTVAHSRTPRRFTRADLRDLPLFAGLEDSGWTTLLGMARPESPADGECVQHAGHPVGRIAVVLSGGLRLIHVEPAGHSRTVRLLGPGDHVGDSQLVLRQLPVHSAFALPGTRLCTISHSEFDELAAAHPALLRRLLESALRRLLATELLLSAQVADTVLTRLASYFLELPGRDDDDGSRLVSLPGSQVDVASYLGTTPETLSRRIRRLTEAGLIARTDGRGGFSLDTDGLSALLRNPDELDGSTTSG